MANAKEEKPLSEQDALKHIEPLAKMLKQTVGQVWKIYIKRYIAKGVSEIFAASVLVAISLVLLWAHHKMWLWLPLPIVLILVFDALQLLINPAYFAIADVEALVKRQKGSGNDIAIFTKS